MVELSNSCVLCHKNIWCIRRFRVNQFIHLILDQQTIWFPSRLCCFCLQESSSPCHSCLLDSNCGLAQLGNVVLSICKSSLDTRDVSPLFFFTKAGVGMIKFTRLRGLGDRQLDFRKPCFDSGGSRRSYRHGSRCCSKSRRTSRRTRSALSLKA